MLLKKLLSACAVSAAIGASYAHAAPATPTIQWKPQEYSFVDINIFGRGSYKDLIKVTEEVEINISWNAYGAWKDELKADSFKVYFDDKLVHEGSFGGKVNGGTIRFPYKKSGRHQLTIEVCNETGCSRSGAKPIVIAGTDGGHLEPLKLNVNPNNKSYDTDPNTVVGAYFVEWGIYGRNFDVTQIPADNLTHILYGFIPICGPNSSLGEIENGNSLRALETACGGSKDFEVVIHDPWAAVQKALPGIPAKDPIRGTYSQLMALKKRNPDLKILPSVGGWTLSDPFYYFGEKKNRDTFVNSMREFLVTWKFYDGVDIDWEFPGGDGAHPTLGDPEKDGETYVLLMKELRIMLDQLEAETGRKYELTSAIGTGYDKIEDVDYKAAAEYMDYIFAMTYDFAGGWNNVTGHQTGIYCGEHVTDGECNGTGLDENGKPRKGPAYTVDNAINLLLAQGTPSEKIVVGAAMYGRGWEGVYDENTTIAGNPMTAPGNGKLTGTKAQGVWEDGVIDYKGIKAYMIGENEQGINGFEVGYDEMAEAAYVWNRQSGKLITYDSPRSVIAKGQYVREKNLAGLFAWEIDADNGDILNAMHEGLAGGSVPKNHAPVVKLVQEVELSSEGSINVVAEATDRENDPLTYTWTADEALTITGQGTASVNVTAPAVAQDQVYTLNLKVSDGVNDVMRQTKVTVLAPAVNQAPVIAEIANLTVIENAEGRVTASVTDETPEKLVYSWELPAGFQVNAANNVVSFVAPEVDQDKSFVAKLTVTDGEHTVSRSFNILVKDQKAENKAPIVETVANVTLEENTQVAVSVAAVDPEGQTLAYSWNVPTGLTVVGSGANVTIKAGEVDADKDYQANVTVSDGTNEVVKPFKVTVTNKASTPPPGNTTWDPNKVYTGGNTVTYQGKEYKAKWWTKGNRPDLLGVWEEVIPDDGKVRDWNANRAYVGGDVVSYDGVTYKARWWTRGNRPDSSSVWQKQ